MTLKRELFRDDGIFGSLLDDSGKVICVTAEHSFDGKPIIPPGTYECVRYASPKFGHDVYLITGVPIPGTFEIHRGNFPQQDSDGCVLIGRKVFSSLGCISDSQVTFDSFMKAQPDRFPLTVV